MSKGTRRDKLQSGYVLQLLEPLLSVDHDQTFTEAFRRNCYESEYMTRGWCTVELVYPFPARGSQIF